jgi:hypothetical protein
VVCTLVFLDLIIVLGPGRKKTERGARVDRSFMLLRLSHHGRHRPTLLQLGRTAARATVLQTEIVGRRRRVRGFHFDGFKTRKRRSAPATWQPWPWFLELVELDSGGEAGVGMMERGVVDGGEAFWRL